ncbi:MAG: hypothetical protein KAZ17_00335 [Sphingorhabdus sp.]|nr:hypothetical protein [Sphingorhabdus sp.]
MTLSRLSTRLVALVAAAVTSSALLFVAPQAHAANPKAAHYTVELAQTATTTRQLVRGVPVKCIDGKCVAPLASTADKNMCVAVSREFGEVTAFTAGKRTFDATQIAACNANGAAKVAAK